MSNVTCKQKYIKFYNCTVVSKNNRPNIWPVIRVILCECDNVILCDYYQHSAHFVWETLFILYYHILLTEYSTLTTQPEVPWHFWTYCNVFVYLNSVKTDRISVQSWGNISYANRKKTQQSIVVSSTEVELWFSCFSSKEFNVERLRSN